MIVEEDGGLAVDGREGVEFMFVRMESFGMITLARSQEARDPVVSGLLVSTRATGLMGRTGSEDARSGMTKFLGEIADGESQLSLSLVDSRDCDSAALRLTPGELGRATRIPREFLAAERDGLDMLTSRLGAVEGDLLEDTGSGTGGRGNEE